MLFAWWVSNKEEISMADAPVAAPSGSKKKMIALLVVGVLSLVGISVGVTMLLTGGKSEPASAAKSKDAEADDEAEPAEAHAEEEAAPEEAAAEGEAKEGEEKASAYVSLDPPFIVNFLDEKKRTKFLKAEISLMAKSPKVQAAIKENLPAVRNALVMLFSRQVFEQLMTPDGKEKLRVDALAEVRAVMTKIAGAKVGKGIGDLFFSSLVMQ
jgi:flagellar FliL protein